jgi:hypothetical protein
MPRNAMQSALDEAFGQAADPYAGEWKPSNCSDDANAHPLTNWEQ